MSKNSSFKIPDSFLTNLDCLVNDGVFQSRGEAIRIAIEDYITENYSFLINKRKNKKEIVVSK